MQVCVLTLPRCPKPAGFFANSIFEIFRHQVLTHEKPLLAIVQRKKPPNMRNKLKFLNKVNLLVV